MCCRYLRIYFKPVLVVLFLLIMSCKEESDSVPELIIDLPSSGSVFKVLDTICIKGTANDETGLVGLGFSLVDDALNFALSGFSLSLNGENTYLFDVEFPIHDVNLASGSYYVKVVAFNKSTSKQKYQEILLEAMPRKLEGAVIIRQQGTYDFVISEMDINMEMATLFQVDKGYSFSEIDSRYQQLYYFETNPAKMACFLLPWGDYLWDITPGFPDPLFTSVYIDDLIYVGSANGKVTGYSSEGIIKFNSMIGHDTIPENIIRLDEIIVTDNHLKTGSEHIIKQYYRASGSYIKRMVTEIDIIDFYYYGQAKLIFFGNDNTGLQIGTYDSGLNHMTTLFESAGFIIDACPGNGSEYIVATTDGIFRYPEGSNVMVPFLPDHDVFSVEYDNINKWLYMASENSIKVVNIYSGSLIFEKQYSESVKNMHLRYNK